MDPGTLRDELYLMVLQLKNKCIQHLKNNSHCVPATCLPALSPGSDHLLLWPPRHLSPWGDYLVL